MPKIHKKVILPPDMCAYSKDIFTQIVDTASSSDIPGEIKQSDIVLLVYDVSNHQTIIRLKEHWLPIINQISKEVLTIKYRYLWLLQAINAIKLNSELTRDSNILKFEIFLKDQSGILGKYKWVFNARLITIKKLSKFLIQRKGQCFILQDRFMTFQPNKLHKNLEKL